MKKLSAILLLICTVAAASAQTTAAKLDTVLSIYNRLGQFNGSALVAYKGQVLLSKGYGYRNTENGVLNDENSIFQLGSISKQLTSALILKLQEEKKLNVKDKLSKYFPGYPKGDSITIGMLATHTSGIYNYTNNADFMNTEVTKPHDRKTMLATFRDRPLNFSPGSKFDYSNSNYMLLGYIIEDVTKMSYYKAMRKYIFTPLGMTHTGFDFTGLKDGNKTTGYFSIRGKNGSPSPYVDSSVSFAAGAVYSTTGDLYKWHRALQENKVFNSALAYQPVKNNYAYGWVIDTVAGKKLIGHTGGIHGYNTVIERVFEDDICIVLLSNVANGQLSQIQRQLLNTIYYNTAPPSERKKLRLSNDILQQYLGEFELRPGLNVVFSIRDGQLHALPTGQRDNTLFAEGDDSFYQEDQDIRLQFVRDENDIVKGFNFFQSGGKMYAKKLPPDANSLFSQILRMDSVLFNAFNRHDLETIKGVLSPDLEFYHDNSGKTGYDQNLEAFRGIFALPNPPRRELLLNTMEVYPIKDFGAMQIAQHRFSRVENGVEGSSIYKFVHIWKKTDTGWKVTRIISYGH